MCSVKSQKDTGKQPKCSLGNDWIKRTHTHTHTHSYIHHGILLTHIKNEIIPFVATGMDLEIIILSEVSQRKISYITYM